MRKHRIIQSAVATAACLALIFGIGYKTIKPEKVQTTAGTNSFVVKVNAAEIKHTKKNQMKIYANPSYTSIWCEGDAGKQFVSYNIKTPLQFEGNNIKTVTYRINKGHFFVTKAEHSKYFKEGELCKGSSQSNYRFFAINAKETPEKQFTVSITDNNCKISAADAKALFDGKAESDSELQARNKALGNVTITCTATFNDGTQKSVNIKVKHQKLTGAQTDSSKFEKDKKYIFVTFEVET
ncbi:MAG: hypothetical protein MSS65_02050 [Clostridium sp.]|nr:hypothetical protein [Clostridium sp.]